MMPLIYLGDDNERTTSPALTLKEHFAKKKSRKYEAVIP